MEYVVGDEHTFDLWVQWTAPNGKVKAVRPKIVAWMDMKSRAIIGDVACIDANSQTLKESLVKMLYTTPGGVPHILHVDNGKDYTAQTMTGQSRKKRNIEFEFDAETVGFYQSIGIEEVGRSLPYQPWDKPIERLFSTVCSKFSKWFESYVGTLTGSKTYAKRQKDVAAMLERGELLTMEEFFEVWTKWKNEKYHTRKHGGLKEAGEKWITPRAPQYTFSQNGLHTATLAGHHKSGHHGHYFRKSIGTGHHRKQEKSLESVVFSRLLWRRRWDSNPRALADYLISSALPSMDFTGIYLILAGFDGS